MANRIKVLVESIVFTWMKSGQSPRLYTTIVDILPDYQTATSGRRAAFRGTDTYMFPGRACKYKAPIQSIPVQPYYTTYYPPSLTSLRKYTSKIRLFT